jgi:hypothetical protein
MRPYFEKNLHKNRLVGWVNSPEFKPLYHKNNNNNNNNNNFASHRWLMPITLATQGQRSGGLQFEASLRSYLEKPFTKIGLVVCGSR